MNKNQAIEYLVTKVHEQDEPLFILRGKDVLARETIHYWLQQAFSNRVSDEKIASAQRVLDNFAMFRPLRLPD